VTTIAINIAIEESLFPFLAVAGEANLFIPSMNIEAEIKYSIFKMFDDISNKKTPYFLLFLNIASILSVTKNPPTTLIVANITPITEKIVANVL